MRFSFVLFLLLGCSSEKSNQPPVASGSSSAPAPAPAPAPVGSAAAAPTSPVVSRPDWAKDKPAEVPDSAILAVEALAKTHAEQHENLINPDCAVETAAMKLLTPRMKELGERADEVDAVHDHEAVKWVIANLNPRIKQTMNDIFVKSIQPTPCKPDPAYKAAALEYVKASGYQAPPKNAP
jgi:hypothetical protein